MSEDKDHKCRFSRPPHDMSAWVCTICGNLYTDVGRSGRPGLWQKTGRVMSTPAFQKEFGDADE